jgi:hypothetical protein
MNDQLSARCSYCAEYATFRIGNNDYELHSCTTHKETAIDEFNVVEGVDSWRMESHSNLGFPKPKVSQGRK